MSDNCIKLLVCFFLFATWIGFTIHAVQNSSDIIEFCKNGLEILGFYHIGTVRGAQVATTFPQT